MDWQTLPICIIQTLLETHAGFPGCLSVESGDVWDDNWTALEKEISRAPNEHTWPDCFPKTAGRTDGRATQRRREGFHPSCQIIEHV